MVELINHSYHLGEVTKPGTDPRKCEGQVLVMNKAASGGLVFMVGCAKLKQEGMRLTRQLWHLGFTSKSKRIKGVEVRKMENPKNTAWKHNQSLREKKVTQHNEICLMFREIYRGSS